MALAATGIGDELIFNSYGYKYKVDKVLLTVWSGIGSRDKLIC